MNEYIILVISSLMLCAMTLLRKKYQQGNQNALSTIVFVGFYSLIICLVGLLYQSFVGFSLFKSMDGLVFVLGLGFATAVTLTTVICILAAPHGSLAVLDMFATLGTVVLSTIYGVIFDADKNQINVWKIVGLVIVVVILFLSILDSKYHEQEASVKNKKMFTLFCCFVFFTNGIALVIYSILTKYRSSFGSLDFVALYSFICFVICVIIIGIFFINKNKRKEVAETVKNNVKKTSFRCILLYTIAFVVSECTSLIATGVMPIIIQAPLSFVLSLVMILCFDWLIYKEKISKINCLQIVLAVCCVVLFVL